MLAPRTRVYARFRGGSTWYPGFVSSGGTGEDGAARYCVAFDDGDVERAVVEAHVVAVGPASRPCTRAVGSRVLVAWKGRHRDFEHGTVVSVNEDGSARVLLDTGAVDERVDEFRMADPVGAGKPRTVSERVLVNYGGLASLREAVVVAESTSPYLSYTVRYVELEMSYAPPAASSASSAAAEGGEQGENNMDIVVPGTTTTATGSTETDVHPSRVLDAPPSSRFSLEQLANALQISFAAGNIEVRQGGNGGVYSYNIPAPTATAFYQSSAMPLSAPPQVLPYPHVPGFPFGSTGEVGEASLGVRVLGGGGGGGGATQLPPIVIRSPTAPAREPPTIEAAWALAATTSILGWGDGAALAGPNQTRLYPVGTQILGNWRAFTTWYPGVVRDVNDQGHALIAYADGDWEIIAGEDRLQGDDMNATTFVMGQRVGVNRYGSGRFVLGRVFVVHPNGTYTVRLDDGEMEESVAPVRLRDFSRRRVNGADAGLDAPEYWNTSFTREARRAGRAAWGAAVALQAATTTTTTTVTQASEGEANSVAMPSDLVVGQRVRCNWRGFGTWYAGRIVAISTMTAGTGAPTYSVAFDDGDFEAGVTRDRIVPTLGGRPSDVAAALRALEPSAPAA